MIADPGPGRGAAEIEFAGETLTLLPERAAYRPADGTLLVADPHFGKAAAFRAHGILVPRGTTTSTLDRLARAVARTGAAHVVFLGDFLHARAGRAARTLDALAAWRVAHPHLRLTLVRGNHDRHAGDPPDGLGIRCVDELLAPPFVYAHHPRAADEGYVLAGHVHPAVVLRGRGRQRTRLPCFHFGARTGILPAFGDFTGAAPITVAPGDRVFAVADDEVVAVN